MDALDQQRLLTKAARLHHTHGLGRTNTASRLNISAVAGVPPSVAGRGCGHRHRTVVAVPPHIHVQLEEQVEQYYGLIEVHVVEAVGDDESEINRDLAHPTAMILPDVGFDAATVGLTSWSRTLG